MLDTFFLLHLTGAAVLWDLKEQRIPNGLIAAGLLCGLWQRLYEYGAAGAALYLQGIMIPFIFPGILYCFRMIGAGDVKLLCVIGGFLGPGPVIRCIIYTFLFGGVISAILIFKRKNLFTRFYYFIDYVSQFLETKKWQPYRIPGDKGGEFCFSLPVFIGMVCVMGGV